MFVPSQADPPGHGRQASRLFGSPPPPLVNLVGPAHTAQLLCPPVEYLLSAPHAVHADAPAPLAVPAGHGVSVLLPSHAYPALHTLHQVCVFLSEPPPVYDPVGHAVHVPFWVVEYFLSSLQSLQSSFPPGEAVPGPHACFPDPPLHEKPSGQRKHVVQVTVEPSPVNDPALQVLQDAAATELYLLSAAQFAHALSDPPEYLPASQRQGPGLGHASAPTVPLLPSQRWPAGHTSHARRVSPELEPPDVKLPGEHVEQTAAPSVSLYRVSAPQFVHTRALSEEAVPFRHNVFVEPPGHADPFGHGVHCVRKELDGPVVKLPGAHSLHPPAKP